jgi:hypothetical protein
MLGRPLGVGHGYDNFGDAGPSVAVVTVIAYLAVVRGAGWLAGLLVAYDAIEIAVFNGLSQREHLLGVIAGAVFAGAVRLAARRSASLGRERTGLAEPAEPSVPAGAGGEYDSRQAGCFAVEVGAVEVGAVEVGAVEDGRPRDVRAHPRWRQAVIAIFMLPLVHVAGIGSFMALGDR